MASAPLDLPLSKEKLDEINAYLSTLTPEEILKWGVDHIPGLYQTTAFGLTGLVAIDMLSKITSSPPPLIFLDTFYHFSETYELVEDVKANYNVPIHVYKPEGCNNVKEFETKHGEKLWEADEDTYDYVVKVEPARRAYADLRVKGVITGRRASQGADRASLQPLEVDSTGLLKLNPLFQWNFHLVEWYIGENKVPRNKLLDQGYRSVGDWHSTTKVTEGQDERAGRWAGREKTECGLHKDYFAMKAQAKAAVAPFVPFCAAVIPCYLVNDTTDIPQIQLFGQKPYFSSKLLVPISCDEVALTEARDSFQNLLQFIRARLPPTVSLRSFPLSPYKLSNSLFGPMALNPDFGPDGRDFLFLPAINSREIEDRVYTHRSFYARPTHVFEDHPSDPSPDNEKFEHLGDAVLGLCVTNLMIRLYPGLHVGPSTKIRALVVGNHTLAAISLKYKLPDRLRLHPAQAIILRASAHIQADVFESYIGGLFHEQGLEAVRRWLDPLFTPYAISAYQIVRMQHGLSVLPTPCSSPRLFNPNHALAPMSTIGHLALFNQHLQKLDRSVEWVYSDVPEEGTEADEFTKRASKTTPVWYVKVLIDGEFYGQGRGNTKKAARNEAAKVGLERLGIRVWCVDID